MSKPPPAALNPQDRRPRMKMKEEAPAVDEGALEGPGKGLHIVQAPAGGRAGSPAEEKPFRVKSEPNERGLQAWETMWQGFFKEAESPRDAWERTATPEVRSSAILSGLRLGPSGSSRAKRPPPAPAEGRARTSQPPPRVGLQEVKEEPPSDRIANAAAQCRRFRGFCYQEAEGPRRAFHELQELCRGWLKPERNTKEQMMELVVLEQFLVILPPEMQNWVRGRGAETCAQAVALAEEFVARQEDEGEEEKWGSQVVCTSDAEATEEGPVVMEAEDGLPYRQIKPEPMGDTLCIDDDSDDDDALADKSDEESQGVPFEKVEFVGAEDEDDAADDPEGSEKHLAEKPELWKPKPSWGVVEEALGRFPIPAESPNGLLKHVCPVCGKAFTRKSSLNRHLIVHAGEKPYRCSHCGKGFNRKTYLQAHEVAHGEEASYQCSDCGKSFRLKWGVTDCQIDPSGVTLYKCSGCKKGSQGEEESYQCSDCGKTFKLKWGVTVYQVDASGMKVYKCASCRKSTRRKAGVAKEKSPDEHKKEAWQMPRETFEAEELSSNQEETEKEAGEGGPEINYPSIICQEGDFCQVTSRSEFDRIKRRCPCPVCGKIFATSSSVNRHIRIHTGEKPFECPDCGKSFNQKTTLLKHQVVHTEQKPYQCSDCGKSFRHSSALLVHKRMHTGERPYKCLVCQRSFTQSAHVIKHIVRKHTREKLPTELCFSKS